MSKHSAYVSEVARSITASLGRFLAIVCIVALGCGFYAGLKMSGPDMRIVADDLYDGCKLYDLRVASSLGFGGDDAERLAAIEGIEAVSSSRTLDVMARMGDSQLVTRLTQLDARAAAASYPEGDAMVVSEDDSYLNRPMLKDGRWPEAADECVMCADKPLEGFGIGDTFEVLYSDTELDGFLTTREFTVVGLVSSPLYPYTVSFGTSSLGSGQVAQYALVGEDAFEEDAPYTELYATVVGASDEFAASDAYQAVVDGVAANIKDAIDELASARRYDLTWEAQAQIVEGREQLEEERNDAEESFDELIERYGTAAEAYIEDARAEAEEAFAEAEQELDDAQAELDAVETPEIYVLDRTKSEGHVAYQADSERIDSIANAFPFMFFLVAALVALTTMTRMVDDDRQQIGTHKALGFSAAKISVKYLVYAALTSFIGALVGIVSLSELFPYVVTSSYSIIYDVPVRFPLPILLSHALVAGCLGVGVTLLATWFAVVASLREVPATLMLPRQPAQGKRILLERLSPVWQRVSFSWKVTLRNLFRYKRRMFMTVLGLAGCTSLLLVGFGLRDAIWDIIACQFGPIIHYNVTVGLDEDADQADFDAVERLLANKGEADFLLRAQEDNMLASSDAYDSTIFMTLVVPEEASEFPCAVSLRERVSQKEIAFDEDSVVVSEKLAKMLGIGVGDEIALFERDAVGNAVGEGVRLAIDGVCENYVSNYVYVGRGAWESVAEELPEFSTFLAYVTVDETVCDELAHELEAMDKVANVTFAQETIELYRSMLSVVDVVVLILIVSAGALVGVVLYNLTNINVCERVREIASLKVLGFSRIEVYQYIFREVLLLSLMGDALGMALGTFLEGFVATTAETDYIMLGRTIHPLSYVLAFVITFAFAVVVVVAMRKRLDRVNMVESLKSVD